MAENSVTSRRTKVLSHNSIKPKPIETHKRIKQNNIIAKIQKQIWDKTLQNNYFLKIKISVANPN